VVWVKIVQFKEQGRRQGNPFQGLATLKWAILAIFLLDAADFVPGCVENARKWRALTFAFRLAGIEIRHAPRPKP